MKKTTPATYPSSKLCNHRRFEFRPENQTAVISGVRAIQQSQLWSKGGKQAVQRSPLEIAASQGQSLAAIFLTSGMLKEQRSPVRRGDLEIAAPCLRSDASEHLFATNPKDD